MGKILASFFRISKRIKCSWKKHALGKQLANLILARLWMSGSVEEDQGALASSIRTRRVGQDRRARKDRAFELRWAALRICATIPPRSLFCATPKTLLQKLKLLKKKYKVIIFWLYPAEIDKTKLIRDSAKKNFWKKEEFLKKAKLESYEK